MARSVITARQADVSGLKELISNLEDLAKGLNGYAQNSLARNTMQAIGETAQEEIEAPAKSNAVSKGVPTVVKDSIFTDFRRIRGGSSIRMSALVGVNKRRSMREWTATANPKSARAKVAPGGKVAMSLATMYEFGTSKMGPRPYLRPAVETGRITAPVKLGKKLRAVITQWAGSVRT